MTPTNLCKVCKEEKPWTSFQKHPRMKTGRCNVCNTCNHKRYRDYRRGWEIQKDFGITLEEYNELLRKTTNCSICGIEQKVSFHLDHNHNTGKIREFLCINCNQGLGQFKENLNSLKNAISYLEKHQCQSI